MKKVSMMGVAVVAILAIANMAVAETIGLDAIHGADTPESLGEGIWYATMRAKLEADGHTLVTLDDFAAQTLQACDIVFVSQARSLTQAFTEAEIGNLHAFVADGNSLVAFAEGGYDTNKTVGNFNDLLAPYGIAINSIASSMGGHTVSSFVEHKLTAELETITIDFQRSLVSIASPAIDLTISGGEDEVVAVVEFSEAEGGGNVIVMSDSALFCNCPVSEATLDDENNLKFLKNVSNFLSVPEPSAVLMILGGALCLVGLWKRSR